jgi:integrase
MSDQRRLVKTSTPGIYRRTNADGSLGAYAVVYRAGGSQRREYAGTLAEARRIKAERTADVGRGEWQERSTVTLRAFLAEWIERYQGKGGRRGGFREGTREEYRRLLDNFAHRYFLERLRLVDVTPYHLAQFVGWLVDDGKHDRPLSDKTVHNVVVPLRAALATAKREGLIRHNPADGLALPHCEEIREDDDEEVKALSRDQLAALLAMGAGAEGLLVELIASTGLRISEAIALQRKHVELDGSWPHVKVRRAIVRGRVGPPKSNRGRRNVALPSPLVVKLRRHLTGLDPRPEQLVFSSARGTALDPNNLRKRMLKPPMEEVGASWAGWHTLRHTFASLQIANGVNVVALSAALGHHSAAFTLSVYVHLLEGDDAPALDLADIGSTVDQQTPRIPDAFEAAPESETSDSIGADAPGRTGESAS